jgi:hypothetical protein
MDRLVTLAIVNLYENLPKNLLLALAETQRFAAIMTPGDSDVSRTG